MRKPWLAAALLLAALAPESAASRPRLDTAVYTPPAEPGNIFTVIDFARSGGTAQPITITEVMGPRHRSFTAAARYSCRHATPAGVVVRFRHYATDSPPLRVTTSGTIVNGPIQGGLPLEALHACYQLVS
jgi:hypothetical protein